MISVIRQSDHRYNVYRCGMDIGCIAASQNPYHNRHCYLKLGLTQFDPAIAGELFHLIRQELGQPLQVMLYASMELHDFLIAGGFQRKRRCYELEATSNDLAAPLKPMTPLTKIKQGTAEYDLCCRLLYNYYSDTHRSISPLTADLQTFCADLPDTVLCHIASSQIQHFAFVEPDAEGYEIAYVGTCAPSDFCIFAQALLAFLFHECSFITAECDDSDPAAMMLKSLFQLPDGTPYDTYILD